MTEQLNDGVYLLNVGYIDNARNATTKDEVEAKHWQLVFAELIEYYGDARFINKDWRRI